jgi:DNA end-binding protein Ku
MSQAVWTGSISFGLVNIPVKLYPATEPKDVRFHLYDRRTGKRVHYERVTRDIEAPTFEPESYSDDSPADDRAESRSGADFGRAPAAATPAQPVERQDMVRGFELPSGDLVTVTDDELVSIAPERSRTIEIEEFVDLTDIDPVFYEKSYHVGPVRGMGAEKPYALLLRAMQGAGMVGIGRFVLRTKPHVVAIRPLKDALALETLFFADEVRSPAELTSGLSSLAVSEREVKTARQLITAMATAGETPVGDLMAALRASVEAAKRKGAKKTTAGSKRVG